jgi:hypothetical protein
MAQNKSVISEIFPVTMSDKEIYDAALEEWTGILAQLWIGIGKPLDPERLKIYRDQLKAVPLGLLELAVSRLFREETWNVVPTVGRIWEAIRKELHDPNNLDEALNGWRPVYARALAGIYNQPTEVVFMD